MGECLTAWRDGEETEEAEAGALTLADAVSELRSMRKVMQALLKAWS